MKLLVVRHAPTAWNREGRLQGRSDVPLDEAGEREATEWALPASPSPKQWFTSPLTRARQTARAMGIEAVPEPSLTEMDWGDWEGRTLADLRSGPGDAMAANEARGLDFRPTNGESPRDVQARLAPWLRSVAASGVDIGAVCHKGVIRAMLALATGWDMTGKPPFRIEAACAQVFCLAPDGELSLDRANVPLTPGDEP